MKDIGNTRAVVVDEPSTDGIPASIPPDDDGIPASIPSGAAGIPNEETTASNAGIPNGDDGIPEDKATTAKVKSSTKTIVAGMKIDDESFDDTVRRIVREHTTLNGEMSDLTSNYERLQLVNTDIREELKKEFERHQAKFDDQVREIGGLRAQVTALTNQIETRLTTTDEQTSMEAFGSLGMKDIADEIHEGCEGDETCIGTVVKLQQTRVDAISKHLDREHDTEQKQLSRDHDATQRQIEIDAKKEAQEKDRALKKELAEKEHANKIELQLAKKGGFKNEFLEDITFLGGGGSKHPRKDMAQAERRAHHAAQEEDDWLAQDLEADESLDMHDDFDESTI